MPRTARFEMRLTPEKLERIDTARGDVLRTTWIEGAINMRLLAGDEFDLRATLLRVTAERDAALSDAREARAAIPVARSLPPAPVVEGDEEAGVVYRPEFPKRRKKKPAPVVRAPAPAPTPAPEARPVTPTPSPYLRRPPPRMTGGRKQR